MTKSLTVYLVQTFGIYNQKEMEKAIFLSFNDATKSIGISCEWVAKEDGIWEAFPNVASVSEFYRISKMNVGQ